MFKSVVEAVTAALCLFNSNLQQKGIQPVELLGDSKTMEDLLNKLSSSYGHSRMFIADEGIRKFQELGQYKAGKSRSSCCGHITLCEPLSSVSH